MSIAEFHPDPSKLHCSFEIITHITPAAIKMAPRANMAKKRKAAEPPPAPKAPKRVKPSKTTKAAPVASKKRKAETETPVAAAPPPARKIKALKKGPIINTAPTQRLNVYVFGEGTAGELGLGTSKKSIDVKRPRLNPNLAADKVGVVQVAAGGMHVVALTHDNKILTWGVNDSGALGRDTDWDGGLRDMDQAEASDSEDEDDDNGLNPKESVPGEVDWSQTELAEGTRFTEVAAGDSCSLVLTDDGRVYGWGTFRSNDGNFGFAPGVQTAKRPMLIPDLKKITTIKAGANHALALDSSGCVIAWGSGQQNQLGRRVIERTKTEGLKPRAFGLPKGPKNGIKAIETGAYHSFAISKNGSVYGWGLNNMGETGIMTNAGQDDATVAKPEIIEDLKGKDIVSIKGAGHHSLAATAEGDCLVWGRIDGHQMGIADDEIAKMPTDAYIVNQNDKPAILRPSRVTTIKGKVVHVAGSSDQSIAVTKEGKAWSWGFSTNYQTGQGTTDDVEVATLIDNTAIREQEINGASMGGQYSIITAPAV